MRFVHPCLQTRYSFGVQPVKRKGHQRMWRRGTTSACLDSGSSRQKYNKTLFCITLVRYCRASSRGAAILFVCRISSYVKRQNDWRKDQKTRYRILVSRETVGEITLKKKKRAVLICAIRFGSIHVYTIIPWDWVCNNFRWAPCNFEIRLKIEFYR